MATKYARTRAQGVYTYPLKAKDRRSEPDLAYVIAYRSGGKLVWETLGRKSAGWTVAAAAEERAKRVQAVRHGETPLTSRQMAKRKAEEQAATLLRDQPLSAIWQSYCATRLRERHGDNSRWQWLAPLHDRRVSSLSQVDLDPIVARMRAEGKAPATVAGPLELFRRLTHWGFKRQMAPRLSFEIEMPKVDNLKTEILTAEQAARLWQTCEEWPDRAAGRLIQVLMLTGMRVSEVLKLKDGDIDRTSGVIWLRATKSGKLKDKDLVPAVDDLLRQQSAWRDANFRGNPLLFPGRHGGVRAEFSQGRAIADAAGLPADFRPCHGLRHNAISQLALAGVPLPVLAAFATQSGNLSVLNRYMHLMPNVRRQASNQAVDLVLAGVPRPAPDPTEGDESAKVLKFKKA